MALDELGESPAPFVAVTVTAYEVPFVKPEIVQDSGPVVHGQLNVLLPSLAVAV